jgi:dihydroxy-acid dehydratase
VKSDVVKKGIERAPHRSLLFALGCTRREMDKPFVGVINSFSEIVPGHKHLREIAAAVKDGVREAGGVPFEVNTIAVCDGIVMNHPGMKYSLPSRELIADSAETVAEAHAFDALVFIPSCDKIVPGMLMAAARLNLPSIFVSGGPMLAGRYGSDSRKVDLISVFEGVGEVISGKMSDAELESLEEVACPGCGSCSGMYTANTMNCLIEVLGIGLPGNGTVPAVDARRRGLAREAGRQVMQLLASDTRPRDLFTSDAFYNALTVDMALGASTNSVLHLMAIAHEAGIRFPLTLVNEISERTPCLCKLSPAYVDSQRKYHMEDLDHAGGISTVMKELDGLLKLDMKTATGKTLAENIADSQNLDPEVIHPMDKAYAPTGGLAILFGNAGPGVRLRGGGHRGDHEPSHQAR